MQENIKNFEIKCLRCNAVYRIPLKYCGENILCDNCGVVFIIPTYEELTEEPQNEDPSFEKVSDETIKINRSGMKEIEPANLKKILQTSNFIIPQRKDKK